MLLYSVVGLGILLQLHVLRRVRADDRVSRHGLMTTRWSSSVAKHLRGTISEQELYSLLGYRPYYGHEQWESRLRFEPVKHRILIPNETIIAAFTGKVRTPHGERLLVTPGFPDLPNYLLITNQRLLIWGRGVPDNHTMAFPYMDLTQVDIHHGRRQTTVTIETAKTCVLLDEFDDALGLFTFAVCQKMDLARLAA